MPALAPYCEAAENAGLSYLITGTPNNGQPAISLAGVSHNAGLVTGSYCSPSAVRCGCVDELGGGGRECDSLMRVRGVDRRRRA